MRGYMYDSPRQEYSASRAEAWSQVHPICSVTGQQYWALVAWDHVFMVDDGQWDQLPIS